MRVCLSRTESQVLNPVVCSDELNILLGRESVTVQLGVTVHAQWMLCVCFCIGTKSFLKEWPKSSGFLKLMGRKQLVLKETG